MYARRTASIGLWSKVSLAIPIRSTARVSVDLLYCCVVLAYPCSAVPKREASICSVSSTSTQRPSGPFVAVVIMREVCVLVICPRVGPLKPIQAPLPAQIFKMRADDDNKLCLSDHLPLLLGTGFPFRLALARYCPGLKPKPWIAFELRDEVMVAARDDVVYLKARELDNIRVPDHVLNLLGVPEIIVLE